MARLSELKALLASAKKAAPAKARPAARPPPAPAPAADPDVDLRAVFADVAPLRAANRATLPRLRPAGVPAQRLADEAAALAASKHAVEPSPAHWDVGQEVEAEQTFLRKGLASDVLSRLRRGHWSVQGELDLHRLNRDEAHDALVDFLNDARNYGWRCVRIVHGKGLSSPNREPVLKGKVRRWLAQRDEILAYCEAPRHAGGAGAVLVLLKASRA
ncbi:MAG TPA: Smr/MutS family protein [Casimicrobiaceae bacterium]|jgi:DNA-nicking Smr family endonuclease|nr:Smr/MutS family protein [Casimicrobiaceae bacterium]